MAERRDFWTSIKHSQHEYREKLAREGYAELSPGAAAMRRWLKENGFGG